FFTVLIPSVPEDRSPTLSPRELVTRAVNGPVPTPCPTINFLQPQNLNAFDFDITGQNLQASILYREPDGNFTAQGFSLPGKTNNLAQLLAAGVGTPLGSIPKAQRFFANCRGLAPWTPAAHPTVLSDLPGTMSQFLVVTNLGGAPYAEVIAIPPANVI